DNPVCREDGPSVPMSPSDKNSASSGGTYTNLSDADLGLIRATEIQEKPLSWLWKYRLASHAMGLLAGDGGLGKSQLLLWIASAVTTGAPWPDKSGDAPLGDVVILSAEDRPEDTIKPRL